MMHVVKFCERAFLLVLAIVGFAVVIGMVQMAAYGEDCKLFECREPAVLMFPESMNLFPVEGRPSVDGVRGRETRAQQAETVTLFGPVPKSEKIEQPDFWRNQWSDGQRLLVKNLVQKGLWVFETKRAITPARPVMVCYAPTSHEAASSMRAAVGDGDSRLNVKFVVGDPAGFPDFIRVRGSQGWPVLHWESPSGRGAIDHGARTLEELVKLQKTEPVILHASSAKVEDVPAIH